MRQTAINQRHNEQLLFRVESLDGTVERDITIQYSQQEELQVDLEPEEIETAFSQQLGSEWSEKEYQQVTVTTIDGEQTTVLVEVDKDISEDMWYFCPSAVLTGEDAYVLNGQIEVRGTDDDLDDWLYVEYSPDEGAYVGGGRGGSVLSSQPSTGGSNSRKQFRSMNQQATSFDAAGRVDDVQMAATEEVVETVASATPDPSPDAEDTLGMATGGQKDFQNPRDNIGEGFVPTRGSLSIEGLFYDYYFDTGSETPKRNALFYPSYSRAVSRNPVTNELEDYLAVGLNSNIAVDEFERPPLDLVVVIDISGSMSSSFSEYYYDANGNQKQAEVSDESKMEAAITAVKGVTEQLTDEDRLGVVLYNNNSYRAKPLRNVEQTDMDSVREHIDDLQSGGGTRLSDGADRGIEMLEQEDGSGREQRMMFLTDQMPNQGDTEEYELVKRFESAAEEDIHTTFVGVGLDTNVDLGDAISQVKGANHYFVHSSEEFTQRLADEFEYMVTPLVYDLTLEIEVDGFEVKDVYGAPSTSDELLHVSTLFPSPPNDSGESKGSIILVELERTGTEPDVALKTGWVTRDGEENGDVVYPDFETPEPDYFANSGIRKAVALRRYVSVLREWVEHSRPEHAEKAAEGQWEQTSVDVEVSDEQKSQFKAVLQELQEARDETGDETLDGEVETVEELLEHGS